MLAKVEQYRSSVTLVPRSGIQFIDFSLSIDAIRINRSFFNRKDDSGQATLVCLYPDEQGDVVDQSGEKFPSEEIYVFSGRKACETFFNQWMPIPFFWIRDAVPGGRMVFGDGPSNWVRARLIELEQPDELGNLHRLTVAFDTALVPRREGRGYLAPNSEDVLSGQEFGFAGQEAANSWFLAERWVDEWLNDATLDYKVRMRAPRKLTEEDVANKLEHWARYLTFLNVLEELCQFPRIRFVDTESMPQRYPPVDVDLVLDVGNSRTCGILVESVRGEGIDLNNSYALELRDLESPQYVYDEPFPSRIEFSQAIFGNERLSKRSGRADAFGWLSVARVGNEALRLSCLSHGSEGSSGLSSPKRYLWDTAPRSHQWHFNRGRAGGASERPITASAFMQYFREDGEVRAGRDDPAPVDAFYSRSSLMCFFLSEVLLQAFGLVNSVAKRYRRSHADVARRLRRVILSMPTAMPLAERRIFSKRAKAAAELVWKALGQEGSPPEVVLQWDEASATQMVFLYNEIHYSFHGDASTFFSVCGRERPEHGSAEALRIASIDIGGGTTDLIITAYKLEGGTAIRPVQEFREGFNLAGDDILCSVIERHVLPAIFDAVRAAGVADPAVLLAAHFGENRGGQTEIERTLRKQFANQVSIPLALKMLGLYEAYDISGDNQTFTLSLADAVTPEIWPNEKVVEFLEKAVHDAGGKGFSLAQVRFPANMVAIDLTVQRAVGPVIADLCEVIYHYDCDYLLLSGRPSRMPAVKAAVLAKMPVVVDRIHAMHHYRVGNWYPFRDVFGRIADPKTTAAVGAMVCALSEGQLEKFHLFSRDMGMKSTARFIGEMEKTGQIKTNRIFFSNLDLDDRRRALPSHTFDFYARTHIGFRQLDLERWPATALYRLDFVNPEDARRRSLPFKLTIERATEDDEEDFRIVEAVDNEGMRVQVSLTLQTLKNAEGYWIDTGVFDTPN